MVGFVSSAIFIQPGLIFIYGIARLINDFPKRCRSVEQSHYYGHIFLQEVA